MSDLWYIPGGAFLLWFIGHLALPGQPGLDPANPIPLPSWADLWSTNPNAARWVWANARLWACMFSFVLAYVAVAALFAGGLLVLPGSRGHLGGLVGNGDSEEAE